MHTLHYFAVEAQDKEEAFDLVQSRLINEDGEKFVDWSDWHVVGGGRWSENPNNQYNDSSEDVISYAENPDKFKKTLEDVKGYRIAEIKRYREQMNTDKLFNDIDVYINSNAIPNNETRFDLNSYYFKKAGDMLMDYYNPDSYFYDLVEYTAHIGYIDERLDNNDKAALQFLVPVDFHF